MHVGGAAEVPPHEGAFDLPDVPHAVVSDVHVLVEREVQVVEAEPAKDSGDAFANTVLKVSGADVSMLKDMGSKLEKSCARNKYGLSESECIDRMRQRSDLCANRTAARFPGQIGDTDRMQIVVQNYVNCIFER